MSCFKYLKMTLWNIRLVHEAKMKAKYMSNKELIRAENISFSYGDQEVLHFKEFTMYEGEKIGIVGVNGVGKTTFLRLLLGEVNPDKGKVIKNCNPFYFEQFSEDFDPFDIDFNEAGQLRIQDKIWQNTVSGGEQTRLRLAQLFSSEKAVVFIDEPTANLDRKGIELISKRIQGIESLLLISHDRELCNQVCNRIIEISDGNIYSYEGNYDSYIIQKENERKHRLTEYEKYTNEKNRLKKIIEKKKEKAKQVEKKPTNISGSDAKARAYIASRKPEGKAKAINKSMINVQNRIAHMDIKEKPRTDTVIKLDFRLTNPPKNSIVIRGENISFSYDDNLIFEDCNILVKNRSKLAILGDNGTGKTTLLNLISKAKDIYVVPSAKIGYLKQNLSQIDLNKTVLENIKSISIQSESITRMVLARLLLTEKDLNKKAHELSGGEKIKLGLAMLVVGNYNILIMDEPTNYLDIPSVEALESILKEYEGTVIFTSHDKTFVDRIATDFYLIKNKKIVSMYSND